MQEYVAPPHVRALSRASAPAPRSKRIVSSHPELDEAKIVREKRAGLEAPPAHRGAPGPSRDTALRIKLKATTDKADGAGALCRTLRYSDIGLLQISGRVGLGMHRFPELLSAFAFRCIRVRPPLRRTEEVCYAATARRLCHVPGESVRTTSSNFRKWA